MSEEDPILRVESVRYRYRRSGGWALDGVSFAVERGTILGLVGPNGSGKTTLYRLILGLSSPDAGRIAVAGTTPSAYRTRHGIGHLPEQGRLPGNVRVRELAIFVGRLAGLSRSELQAALERLRELLRLEDVVDARIGTLSHGYRQRVGLLAALLGDPELLLLDEPANGLDPTSVGVLRSLLRDSRRRGRTVIVSSHNLLELERVCDEVIILSQGRSLGRASRAELVARPDIWVVQLGEDARRTPAEQPAREVAAGAIRLAADELAFPDEEPARRFARLVENGGGVVELIEQRPFDLECLFHSLVDEGSARAEKTG
jgi:ABC-type multidrug transport system ATPase subunit